MPNKTKRRKRQADKKRRSKRVASPHVTEDAAHAEPPSALFRFTAHPTSTPTSGPKQHDLGTTQLAEIKRDLTKTIILAVFGIGIEIGLMFVLR